MPSRTPVSTYRLQVSQRFTFQDVDRITAYLNQLGITDLYLSPILTAKSGSVHGYDVVNPTTLNPELGTEKEFERLVKQLRELRMGMIIDVVPNHMCISDSNNAWWFDVLENGPSSPYALFFDIDWHPLRENLANKVLLPVLDRQYGQALEEQCMQIQYTSGSFVLLLNGAILPVNPRTWPIILQPALNTLKQRLGESSEAVLEFESILTALRYLPSRTETNEERVRERQREKEIVKRRLAELETGNDVVREVIKGEVNLLNGIRGIPSSFDRFDELLESQAYRLSFWRVAAEEINFRRFFDINDLAAIRIEDPGVFPEVHKKTLELVKKGWITGLRIDHADGLFDPLQYFEDLQHCSGVKSDRKNPNSLYVVAEKILSGDERLRPDWRISGTTGYEFLNLLNGVFVWRPSRKMLRAFFSRKLGLSDSFEDVVYDAKKLILNVSMASELNVLSRRLDRICQKQRHSRDFTLENLRFALGEVIACFPVYRTYTRLNQNEIKSEDLRHTLSAIRMAKARNPASSEHVFDFIASLLLLQDPENIPEEEKIERRLFIMRLQQLTGPVMAKGLEDTAFYRYFPLASLNEVGGSPESFGISVRYFHAMNRERMIQWPHSLLASSTHDTKWGEDGRSRLNVLSEIPLHWIRAVRRWEKLNRGHKTRVAGVLFPDHADEYRFYQALVATWPGESTPECLSQDFLGRIQAFMQKAAREAKIRTSWIQPNDVYEKALYAFVEKILSPASESAFIKEFFTFHRMIAAAGIRNSLSQTLLKMVSPGVPDFYQGCEFLNYSLVDPDNRRPVDFDAAIHRLAELDTREAENPESLLAEISSHLDDGRAKLWIVTRALRLRRANPELFSRGTYVPLRTIGERRNNVIAIGREMKSRVVIAAAGRFFVKLLNAESNGINSGVWNGSDLALPRAFESARYRDIFTNKIYQPEMRQGRSVLPLNQLFSLFPVALLETL